MFWSHIYFLVPHKQFLLNPICQRIYLFLSHVMFKNLFPPDIHVVLILMSRVYYWTHAKAKAAARGRKTGETSCQCISFAPAEIV